MGAETFQRFTGIQRPDPDPAQSVSMFLVQREGGKYARGIIITTNAKAGDGNGWVRNHSIWARKNVHFNDSDKNYNTAESECWQINHNVNFYNYSSKNVFLLSFKSFQRAEFDTTTAVALEFWVNDQYDMMFLRYYILPILHGFARSNDLKWKSREWHPEAIIDDADRKRLVSAAREFGKLMYPLVKEGFANDLPKKPSVTDFAFQK